MRISQALFDPQSLSPLRDMPLVEAMGFAVCDVQGSTRVELISETLEDNTAVFMRSVELLSFLAKLQHRHPSGFLEFAMEPAARFSATGGKIQLFDWHDEGRLLDEFDDEVVTKAIASIDRFLEEALAPHSPLLLDHLLNRRFLGPAFSAP